MKSLDVCLSPDLIAHHSLEGKIAVVVDILRATSCMTAGIGSGIQKIRPFESQEECLTMRDQGYLIAGERNGQKVEGFDLGNSPFDYMNPRYQGKNVAVTTTNGTVAIERVRHADEILIGSFLNMSALTKYILGVEKSVLIICAGWKGKVNLEDTLFAGALVHGLKSDFSMECDAPTVALAAYLAMKDELLMHVLNSSHAERLKRLNIEKDIAYCLKYDQFDIVPKLINGEISDPNSI